MKIQEIKKGDYIKRYATTYLIKGCQINKDKRTYTIDYFFCITNKGEKKKSKLYRNGSRTEYLFDFERVNIASDEDIRFLNDRISKEFPNFNLDAFSCKSFQIENLNEDMCIDFLKKKGYLIIKVL